MLFALGAITEPAVKFDFCPITDLADRPGQLHAGNRWSTFAEVVAAPEVGVEPNGPALDRAQRDLLGRGF